MFHGHKIIVFIIKLFVFSFLILSASPAGQGTSEDENKTYHTKDNQNTMSSIPKAYGRLIDIDLYYPDRKHHIAELWFEDEEGTIRIVTVAKGKSPDDQPKIDDRIRVIPDSNHVQILTTHDGSTIIGRIVLIGESDIQFETELGKMTIPIIKIKKIREVSSSSIKKGQYWFQNPHATRLYFAPTGRMLKQGEGYFANFYIFLTGITYGITDNITIGGGISLFPGVPVDEQIFYFTPKIGVKATKNFNIAVGALLIKIPNFDDEEDAPFIGTLYGVTTYGTLDASITAGIGFGFVDNEFGDKPMVMFGGEKRLSRRMAVVTENWILPGVDDPLISYGIRFMGEKLSVDLALVNTLGEHAIFPGIPYIDFVVKF